MKCVCVPPKPFRAPDVLTQKNRWWCERCSYPLTRAQITALTAAKLAESLQRAAAAKAAATP